MSGLAEHLEAEACPHLAVLLHDADELPEVLVSFYALGVRRGGWLAHRALPGDTDHERRVLSDAGLDVAALEASERMAIVELDFDVPAERSTDRWRSALDDALAQGCTGLWYARFPVNPGDAGYDAVLGYEREWHRTFRDRPVVTICPFIVGGLDRPAMRDALAEVSAEPYRCAGRRGRRRISTTRARHRHGLGIGAIEDLSPREHEALELIADAQRGAGDARAPRRWARFVDHRR